MSSSAKFGVAVMALSVYVSGVRAINVQTATVGNPGNAGENSGESEPGGDGPTRPTEAMIAQALFLTA